MTATTKEGEMPSEWERLNPTPMIAAEIEATDNRRLEANRAKAELLRLKAEHDKKLAAPLEARVAELTRALDHLLFAVNPLLDVTSYDAFDNDLLTRSAQAARTALRKGAGGPDGEARSGRSGG